MEIPHPRLRNLNFNQLNNVITSPGCDNDNLITQIVEYFSEKIVFWPKSNRIGFGVVFNDQIVRIFILFKYFIYYTLLFYNFLVNF